jgi:type I restriction enzyme M protein
MVSKLSEDGVAGFVLSNGALSGGGEEYKIRRRLIENGLVEAIIILPGSMFYTTDISVSIWLINNNKKERFVKLSDDISRNYRDRHNEILFMDLRQIGEPFEKKFVQFNETHIKQIATTYHAWQQKDTDYKNIPEYCYATNIDEVAAKDFSLVPSKYIEFINRDENIDYEVKMNSLQGEITTLLKEEITSKDDLLNVFKELGYEIKL